MPAPLQCMPDAGNDAGPGIREGTVEVEQEVHGAVVNSKRASFGQERTIVEARLSSALDQLKIQGSNPIAELHTSGP